MTRMSIPTFFLGVLALMGFSPVTVVHAAEATVEEEDIPFVPVRNRPKNLKDSCRADGFDPWQLACDTCEILLLAPELADAHKRCLECCQEWKSSKPLVTKPYHSAVLVYRANANDDSEMEQFLRDHWDDVLKKKGAKHLIKMPQDNSYLDDGMAKKSRFMFMRPPPEMVLWFEGPVPKGLKNVLAYKAAAKEVIDLDGYKKDDMKDMLSTMLADLS